MEFPEPVIELSLEPKTKADQDKMGLALAKLAEEDPTFKTYTNKETDRQSSLVSVNFTSISSLTVCAVNSMLKQTLVNLRLLTVKPFAKPLNVKENTSVSPVVKVSTVTYGSNLNRMKKVRDMNSWMP